MEVKRKLESNNAIVPVKKPRNEVAVSSIHKDVLPSVRIKKIYIQFYII